MKCSARMIGVIYEVLSANVKRPAGLHSANVKRPAGLLLSDPWVVAADLVDLTNEVRDTLSQTVSNLFQPLTEASLQHQLYNSLELLTDFVIS